jgi:hypothetical protein
MAHTAKADGTHRTLSIEALLAARPAHVVPTRTLGDAVKTGAVVGAFVALVMAAALAQPADLLVHVSNVIRLVATGAIAGACSVGMFSAEDAT